MLYRVLRIVAAIGLRWYYRGIEVAGLEHVPRSGPLIVAANHWNALVDALLVAYALPRRVRFTAKATLLDHVGLRLLFRLVGVVPLRRVSDEVRRGSTQLDAARNAESFAAILDALQAGEAVLIFPEGRSHSEPSLSQLRTGCARLALLAQSERGLHALPILPVGLTFEDKGRPRTRAVVQMGRPVYPLLLSPAARESARVQHITEQLDVALRAVTLNFPTAEDSERVLAVASLLTQVFDRTRPLASPDPPLVDAMAIARRVESARQALPAAAPELLTEVNRFLDRLDQFRRRLASLRIPVNEIWMSIQPAAGAWFAIREVCITLSTLPIAAWGRVNHWVPLFLAQRVGRATSVNPDEPAMRTLVSGVLLVLLFYALVTAAVAWWAGGWWAALYVVSLPPSASLDFWITERLRRARLRARAYFALRGHPVQRAELLGEAHVLRTEAVRLNEAIARI